jgi:hypothetical protein
LATLDDADACVPDLNAVMMLRIDGATHPRGDAA